MNEEDELYGMEGTGRFDTDEFDQEYVDGGIRDDVRNDDYDTCALSPSYALHKLTNALYCIVYIVVGSNRWCRSLRHRGSYCCQRYNVPADRQV